MEPDPLFAEIAGVVELWDAEAQLFIRRRDGGLLDLTVISERFAELSSEEREHLFWQAAGGLPGHVTLQLTYALLITRQEAEQYSFPTKEIHG